MPHAHDFAIIRPRGNLQTLGKRLTLNHQGVITRRGKRAWQPGEHTDILVMNLGCLAVHELLRMHDLAAEGLADTLMPQAHAENRDFARELFNRRHRHPCFIRRAGPGRDHDVIGFERIDAIKINLIVTVHLHLLPQLAKILHQVVGEGIVIVDHQKHVITSLMPRIQAT